MPVRFTGINQSIAEKKHSETNFVDVSSDDDVALRGVHQRLEAIEVVGADDAARVRRLLG